MRLIVRLIFQNEICLKITCRLIGRYNGHTRNSLRKLNGLLFSQYHSCHLIGKYFLALLQYVLAVESNLVQLLHTLMESRLLSFIPHGFHGNIAERFKPLIKKVGIPTLFCPSLPILVIAWNRNNQTIIEQDFWNESRTILMID